MEIVVVRVRSGMGRVSCLYGQGSGKVRKERRTAYGTSQCVCMIETHRILLKRFSVVAYLSRKLKIDTI